MGRAGPQRRGHHRHGRRRRRPAQRHQPQPTCRSWPPRPATGCATPATTPASRSRTAQSYDSRVWARTTTPQTLTARPSRTARHDRRVRHRRRRRLGRLEEVRGHADRERHHRRRPARRARRRRRPRSHLDQVSLFPQDTWVGPVNGKSRAAQGPRREDRRAGPVASCASPAAASTNVGTFTHATRSRGYTDRRRTYQWKETIGPVEERATNWNFWGYNQSLRPRLPASTSSSPRTSARCRCRCVLGRRQRLRQHHPRDDRRGADRPVDPGHPRPHRVRQRRASTTEWGAKRAALGHPEPFELTYIGLGNEENTDRRSRPTSRSSATPSRRRTRTSRSSPTPARTTPARRFDTPVELNRDAGRRPGRRALLQRPELVPAATPSATTPTTANGPHGVPRRVRLARQHAGGTRLTEAAYMTGLERNADVVELASYAPLLANESTTCSGAGRDLVRQRRVLGHRQLRGAEAVLNNVGDQVVPEHADRRPSVEPKPTRRRRVPVHLGAPRPRTTTSR